MAVTRFSELRRIRIRPRRYSGRLAIFIIGSILLFAGCVFLTNVDNDAISNDLYDTLFVRTDLTVEEKLFIEFTTIQVLASWVIIIIGIIVTALGFWWAVSSVGDVRKISFEKDESLGFHPDEVYKGIITSVVAIPLNLILPGAGNILIGEVGKRLAPQLIYYDDDPFDYVGAGQKQILLSVIGWILAIFSVVLGTYFEGIRYSFYTFNAIMFFSIILLLFTIIWSLGNNARSFFNPGWGAPRDNSLYYVLNVLGLGLQIIQTIFLMVSMMLILLVCADWFAVGMSGMGVSNPADTANIRNVTSIVVIIGSILFPLYGFLVSIRKRYFPADKKHQIKPAG